MLKHIRHGIALMSLLALPQLSAAASDEVKLTVGVPAYVGHPGDRTNPKGWNDGWFNNEGILVDVTWPVLALGENTQLRGGGTVGGFDNSIFRTSVFVGGVGEIEHYISKDVSLSLGTYAGVITGYDDAVNPAIAPYIGASYEVLNKMEIGLRGFWLPAKTIGGRDLAESDAYIAAITLGTRF